MASVLPQVETPLMNSEPSNRSGEPIPPETWFDRSSITADAMVTIQGVSEEDWWKYAPEDRICEFFDGVVYMPSPATDEHQDEVLFLSDLLNGLRHEAGRPIIVRLGPAVLRLAPGQFPEPDIFVLPKFRTPNDPPGLLIVEVFSKSTKSHDIGLKADRYREAEIPELLHVDLTRRQLIVHRLTGGVYNTEVFEDGFWHSTALPGFWLDVTWLWANDLPNPRRCLEMILAGPPT